MKLALGLCMSRLAQNTGTQQFQTRRRCHQDLDSGAAVLKAGAFSILIHADSGPWKRMIKSVWTPAVYQPRLHSPVAIYRPFPGHDLHLRLLGSFIVESQWLPRSDAHLRVYSCHVGLFFVLYVSGPECRRSSLYGVTNVQTYIYYTHNINESSFMNTLVRSRDFFVGFFTVPWLTRRVPLGWHSLVGIT